MTGTKFGVDAEASGKVAYWAGVALEDNPYSNNDPYAKQWEEGWKSAQEDDK
jgi:ribosome modulation factor